MSNDRTAELLAAVRAVENGERSADTFFTERKQPASPARRPAAGGAQDRADAGGVPAGRAPAGQAAPRPARGEGLLGGRIVVPEEVRALLAEGGAPESLAPRVVEALGEGAAEVLRADPWQLLAVAGVHPEQADGFARALLGEEAGPGDARRAVALVVRLLERAALRGDTVQEPAALAEGLARHALPDPQEAVREAVDAGAVLVFEDALDAGPTPSTPGRGSGQGAEEEAGEEQRPVRMLFGLDRYALAEESLADALARIASTFDTAHQGRGAADTADTAVESAAPGWSAAAEAAPSPSAKELIATAAGSGLVTHSGGEASRAEIAALVVAARRLGLRAWALTHTDDGRARMTRLVEAVTGPAGTAAAAAAATAATQTDEADGETGQGGQGGESGAHTVADTGCATVAGTLAGTEGPERDAEGMLAVDLLAVCDAPQLDAEGAAALLESLPDGARLVLSGDPGVLGAAGPGQVFGDLVAARYCPHVASRTPDPGPVGELVSGIGVGELLQVEAPGKEVVIVPVQDAGEAVHRTVQLVADSVPRAIGVPTEDTQVITPGHGGSAGTRALNAALKERLNPGPGRFAGFDPGDRVAHSPAPGRTEIGTVASADEEGLHLSCHGRTLTVPPDRVPETLRHGWAMTAHQAAGLRWPAAVVVLPGDATEALSRAWVYTAFGRGEQHLSVVHGAGDALPRAVVSGPAPERVTRLRVLLTESARAAEADEVGEGDMGSTD
ncbi:exodeoxyribonuclease V [Streptomyces diacarni]|uniref:Exodeoxyribonuclease V n=1 Tax=Streptomyces diacarni TaxID=2800381 RepID=A0A367FD17_9ACTN|nr:helix-hairpin-helix domain-containing protein [Streptomyces diacarni]RCG27585.1 exodeoxyribonuclease V [Streptomyces diacarni]